MASLMRRTLCAILLLFCVEPAFAESLPASAKKASLEEFKALADGKTVTVEIFDLEVPVTATLVWSWENKSITGTAVINNKDKIDVHTTLSFDGDKACSQGEGDKEPGCHVIYIDGNKFYEVRDDGEVHAVSTVQN